MGCINERGYSNETLVFIEPAVIITGFINKAEKRPVECPAGIREGSIRRPSAFSVAPRMVMERTYVLSK